MKSKLFFIISFVGLICFSSCKNRHAVDDPHAPLVVIYEQEDSTAIIQLAQEYVTRFNGGDFNQVADLLYFVRNDSVFPLTQEQREGFVEAMGQIGRLGCQLKDMELNTFKDNKVRVSILMDENGSLDEERGTINMFLNPVKINNQWYLTLYDRFAEGVGQYINVVHERQD